MGDGGGGGGGGDVEIEQGTSPAEPWAGEVATARAFTPTQRQKAAKLS